MDGAIQDAIRFALDHFRRIRASVPLEHAISQLIETKHGSEGSRGVPRYHHCADEQSNRRDLRTLWGFAERRGWAIAATASKPARAKAIERPPGILRPSQVGRCWQNPTTLICYTLIFKHFAAAFSAAIMAVARGKAEAAFRIGSFVVAC